jgi:hypothetical protein
MTENEKFSLSGSLMRSTLCVEFLFNEALFCKAESYRGPGSVLVQVIWDLWRTNDTGECFLRVLRFPLPLFIPTTALYSLIILLRTLRLSVCLSVWDGPESLGIFVSSP